MSSGKKTVDGVKLSNIENLLNEMGAKIRTGGKHQKVVGYSGYEYSTALGPSTHCKKRMIPWMKKAFGNDYQPQYVNKKLRINYA